MSGVAGIIHFDGAPVEPGLVKKMTAAMSSRGPDGINHWNKGSVALGHCMLHTTSESLEVNQPLTNEDETMVLVMDGWVDNGEELRKELLRRRVVLRNRSDAELILKAYEIWGEACPNQIIGEYVFFIWDSKNKSLFGARDAIGTRHFYYYVGKGWFAFASEIKGLLVHDHIDQQLNESRLLDYLVVHYDRDDEIGTFYKDICRLPAGHAMSISLHGTKTWRYWNPENLPQNHYSSLDECAEAFLEQLRIAVRCRLRSIGQVGAMFSGGLDSSSIVGLVCKEFQDCLNQPLKTFSLILEDRENCPDWESIQEMLKNDGMEPIIITSASVENVYQSYIDNIKNLNEPFSLSGGFTDSIVYESARNNNCRVVLDGMAGDLLFYSAGRSIDSILRRKIYSKIPDILAAYRRHNVGNGLLDVIWKILRLVSPRELRTIYQNLYMKCKIAGLTPEMVPGDNFNFLCRDTANQLLKNKNSQYREKEQKLNSSNDQSIHAQFFTSGMLSFAHEVNGQIALSKGVEPRSPFSDQRMVEFAIQMPVEAKLFAPWHKHVLRKSMDGILPESVRWRCDIGGNPGWKFHEQFVVKMAQASSDVWNSEHIISTLEGWLDRSKFARLWDEYDRTGAYCAGFNLFTLAILSQWLITRRLKSL